MQETMRIAVAGATGRVGRYVVDTLKEQGHEIVPMSRSYGVDVVTGAGLADALAGVDGIVDCSTGPSPEQAAATEFFTTAAQNLQEFGTRAGVRRLVVVSIIGTDKFVGGYGAAKLAHEQAVLAGPIPSRVLRAAQFHEFVGQLVDWGTQGDVAYVAKMRTQVVAARTVADALVVLVTDPAFAPEVPGAAVAEIAGPREEDLVDLARRLMAHRGDARRIEGASDPTNPDDALSESGALLPNAHATLAGPTFAEWLETAQ